MWSDSVLWLLFLLLDASRPVNHQDFALQVAVWGFCWFFGIYTGYFGKVVPISEPTTLFISWFDLQEAFKRSSKLHIGTVVDVHVSHWITTKSYCTSNKPWFFESYHTIAICLSRSNSCFIYQMHFLTLPLTESQHITSAKPSFSNQQVPQKKT